ncbi:MAG: NTP transferase domain-containing protein, partial [Candidatus Levybacteria bacterium]|nr:NTP transferase domain-containing protein [Candidatus Levybacteria bacterium]
MKGVILAGGLATRLRPLTQVTNKHLLPIYNRPMIYYPLQAMQKAGIKEVLLTSSPDHAGDFANLLGAGEEFNMRLYYAVQKNPKGGIANAIALAEEFALDDKILVVLG